MMARAGSVWFWLSAALLVVLAVFLVYPLFNIVTGSFGTGSWPDHALLSERERERGGTHEPVWVPLEELPRLDVRPRALGALLSP